jgi:hypothetical protein
MSTAEKLMCEWEARHDVAARKRIADVAPVQHYLTHCRCDDDLHRPEPSKPHARHEPAAGTAIPPGVRQWFRWGEEGRSDAPVIPHNC